MSATREEFPLVVMFECSSRLVVLFLERRCFLRKLKRQDEYVPPYWIRIDNNVIAKCSTTNGVAGA